MSKILLPIILLITFLVGCSNVFSTPSIHNPTPKDFLKKDHADIFLLDGYVYSNAKEVEWLTELEYELGEQVGTITKQANAAFQFTHGTANKLPIGTNIFKTNTPAYIAIVDGKEIPYLKMVEG